jgi:hypothetical protein
LEAIMKAETLRWIEEQKPALVASAEQFLDRCPIHESKKPGGKDPKIAGSQLRNLLNAAKSGESLVVIRNFLRYQIGRGSRGWGDTKSGEALVTLLDSDVGARVNGYAEIDASERHAVEARLTALFFGYLIRHFTYKCRLVGTGAA